ncbi:RNA guanylyltransferase and 5'-phosphatase mRNA capping enzyme [Cotesia typhae]|uniref:RNA guanylyltransferase and 5'-phosphatase mRNA capping enzyme n=1 Tax=Cotesia typhae TaxID=2053667 RepID=UPI003D68C322
MSSVNGESSKGPIPPRWLHCPRKSVKLIHNKFLAFKTPLSTDFDDQVSEDCRFNIDMLFTFLKSERLKIGLWIDLTNTTRFYEQNDVEAYGCKYFKLQCRGHGETPSRNQSRIFVEICKNFIAKHPLEIIGVHCTHGFNRTGFLIISYLVETDQYNLDAAMNIFSAARPPGIYKDDYIKELYRRYDDVDDAPPAPSRPTWYLEYDDDDDVDDDVYYQSASRNQSHGRRKREYVNKNPVFMAGVPGVVVVNDHAKSSGILRQVQKICGWNSNGFPGSQPVSMDRNNIKKLEDKPYRVSWKADGTRYMLFILGDNELFFIDRDNNIFQIFGLTFPHAHDTMRNLKDTLLDGEMVIDDVNGQKIPRYLAYDIIMYDGMVVRKKPFFPDRYALIEKEVMGGRYCALREGRLQREHEPFSVRLKQFYDIAHTGSLLSEKFAKQLGHQPDGLIFQPAKDPYIPGTCDSVLKWKPLSLNSVDFKLKIVTDSGLGILPTKKGMLFVGGLNKPFDKIEKPSKALRELNNKIIECKWENNKWVFMRERADKSFPNSYNTAVSVCRSIKEPITNKYLLDFIEQLKFEDDSDLMPPPSKRMR